MIGNHNKFWYGQIQGSWPLAASVLLSMLFSMVSSCGISMKVLLSHLNVKIDDIVLVVVVAESTSIDSIKQRALSGDNAFRGKKVCVCVLNTFSFFGPDNRLILKLIPNTDFYLSSVMLFAT